MKLNKYTTILCFIGIYISGCQSNLNSKNINQITLMKNINEVLYNEYNNCSKDEEAKKKYLKKVGKAFNSNQGYCMTLGKLNTENKYGNLDSEKIESLNKLSDSINIKLNERDLKFIESLSEIQNDHNIFMQNETTFLEKQSDQSQIAINEPANVFHINSIKNKLQDFFNFVMYN